uniref:KIAA0825 n=1 Tax=Esox lucius TaxID=8010 RepID=A0A3P9AA19_ESOLU
MAVTVRVHCEWRLSLSLFSIEQSLKALQQKMGESWTEDDYYYSFCSPPPPLKLHYLKTDEEEREDLTLQLLVNISSQCGVSFPGGATSSTLMKPGPSVHAAREEGPLESLELWDEVRLLLRRRLLDRLALPLPVPRRIHCLQQLLFLYPAWEVLTLYQGLRSRAALSLLHSALGSGPGATGFDRLALGVGAAAPALCSAIREELHVLNGVADPHTILGFLNAAYLDTVSRELAAMMGRECESALKDNTMLSSSKGRRISARPKTAVAPLEVAPETGRNFSLTAHQLRALTQLACTLLGLERQVEELATQLAFINCAGETPCSPLVLEFEWRTAFRELVPQIAHCVKVVLEDVCSKALRQEEELSLLSGSAHIALTNTPDTDDSALTCPGRDIPKMVAKFCGDIIRECNALLPLAEACGDGVLLEVRCSFVEACARVASAMLGRVEERAGQVPSGAPLKNLATLLGTSVYVHQWLCHYHDRLKETSMWPCRPLTLLPIQRYLDVTEGLREQLTSYCGQVCSSTILQDAESHDWAHTKTFYEGERCSFSVQMWHYFLSGLRADLWLAVPGCVGRDVLAQVVSESLQVLVQRYSRARPSYRRHLQIRFDITAVLLCVEQLMWSLCERTESLLGLEPSAGRHAWVATIHSLCDQLLTTLVIVTAPLAHLYRPTCHCCCVSFLLDGLVGDAASECQLRLLTSDPGYSPRLLLTSILHRDCHLLRVLLESSCKTTDFNENTPPYLVLKLQHTHTHTECLPAVSSSLTFHPFPSGVVNLAVQALSFIYTNLPLAVASIPLPVRFLFHTAEKHLSQHARQLRSTGLLIWSLLSCLCQLLEEPNSLELLWSLPLDQGAKENLSLLSECLQGSMGQGQQKGVPKPTVHKVLQVLEENRPKWSSMQLLKARKLCSESAFEQGESGVAQERDGSVDEATERKKALALLEICHKPGGAEYLRQIYHIIRVNEVGKLSFSSNPHKSHQPPVPASPLVCRVPLLTRQDQGKDEQVQSVGLGWVLTGRSSRLGWAGC